ncbi:hypothetical protein AWH62_01345 [Maricaulis sp. W15]|uniref:GtrA family protein n=1 Tax=Maricaulis TaxID=74317 RepID=UPI000949184F|nr:MULTISPECIES: GtrA family protein [Maricaulis]OLF81345.1 hypothetical protein AWH62_01345 [Maricaulis sp. W15]
MVGIVANTALFGLYLVLASWGATPPLVATSLVYAIGIVLTYLGNALWSFERARTHAHTAPRYVAAYFIGYIVQAGGLQVFLHTFSVPHQIAQLMAMACAAGSIFLLLNIWVFAANRQQRPNG